MKSNSLIIKFEGDKHQIDANTLVNTLIHYSALINQINNIYGEGHEKINIQVNAPEKGSFVIDISVIKSIAESIFSNTKESVAYLGGLIGIATAVISVYKHYKGKRIDDVKDVTTITNIYNIDNKTITNIYNDTTVRQAISKSIETAENDENIDGISISSKDGKYQSSISRSEFQELINNEIDDEIGTEHIKKEIVYGAILHIITLSFDDKTKWRFIYNGVKLPLMSMKDSGLKAEIDKGRAFAKGDAIKVTLEITQKFNTDFNAWENIRYKIREVHNHIQRPQQAHLFD